MSSIVMVDDEENILSSLRRILHKEKAWHIATFTDTEEALAYIADNDVEVVISDYQMPGMNGTQFLAEVKRIKPDTMRLILSGYADVAALMNAINSAEIYRYICKPIDEFELVTTIRRALNHLDVIKENERLANIVRDQQRQIDQHKAAISRILEDNPDIVSVERDEEGAIVIDDESLNSDITFK